MSKKPKGKIPERFPDQVRDAHRRLAEADKVRKSGRYSKAIKLGESLIDDYPDYVAALHTLGLAHMGRNGFWPALSCFMRAAMLNPTEWTILVSLAQAYLGLGANEMAARTLEQARALNDDESEVHYTLGLIYERDREYERAAEALERTLALKADHAKAAMALGSCYVHLGNQEAAGRAFLRSHELDPAAIEPISASAQLTDQFSLFDEEVALSSVADRPGEDGATFEARKAFTRANLLHRKGEFAAAWDQLLAANRHVAERHQEGLRRHLERRGTVTRLTDAYESTPLPVAGDPAPPISLFILGVSRSGKTTVERVLGTLPGVKCGYENPIVERAAQRASQSSGLLTISQLGGLPAGLGDTFAHNYKAELLVRADAAKVFTNTHPGRIADVGHLAARVPNVRFLFVVRDRNDTALRIFMKHFREDGNFYAYDVGNIFEEIDWYHGLIETWHARLPTICRTIRYDQLVEAPHEAISVAAELCGLGPVDLGKLRIGDDRGCAKPYLNYFTNQ